MKHLIVATVSAVALMAGAAYAGGGCNYGNHAAEVSEADEPILAAADETDPKLLARIKELEAKEALEKLLETPVIHN